MTDHDHIGEPPPYPYLSEPPRVEGSFWRGVFWVFAIYGIGFGIGWGVVQIVERITVAVAG